MIQSNNTSQLYINKEWSGRTEYVQKYRGLPPHVLTLI